MLIVSHDSTMPEMLELVRKVDFCQVTDTLAFLTLIGETTISPSFSKQRIQCSSSKRPLVLVTKHFVE
jgi:hypothetical protein